MFEVGASQKKVLKRQDNWVVNLIIASGIITLLSLPLGPLLLNVNHISWETVGVSIAVVVAIPILWFVTYFASKLLPYFFIGAALASGIMFTHWILR